MDNSKLKDMVKDLKKRTGKMVEGEYEEKSKKTTKSETKVDKEPKTSAREDGLKALDGLVSKIKPAKAKEKEKIEVKDTPSLSDEVKKESAPVVEEAEVETATDDIDAKIAEYYRKKQAKIAELEKAEQEEAMKIIKKSDPYEDRKKEYADIFSGIMISRDDLDKENIGRAVLNEFEIKDDGTEEIDIDNLDSTTMGMESSDEDKADVMAEITPDGEDSGDIDEYIMDAKVLGGEIQDFVKSEDGSDIEPEAKKEIESVIATAKKKPAPKKDALKGLTAKLTKKKEETKEENKEKEPAKKATKTPSAKSTTTKKSTTKTSLKKEEIEKDTKEIKKTTKKSTSTKSTTAKSTTTKSTTAKKTTTTKKTASKAEKPVEANGVNLSEKEMDALVNDIIPEDGIELTTKEMNTLVEEVTASDENAVTKERELTEGWSVGDYNKLVGIKEEDVKAEEIDGVSKDGTLDSGVALNESDIEYLEREGEVKTDYFYGSEEHKENEESKKSDSPVGTLNEIELGDKNLNKDIANATPSSEIKPMAEVTEMTEEERFAREMEYIYTIFGVEEKARQVNLDQKRVLYVATECQPFAATGGLADVAGSLPNAIANLGVDIRVIMPLYGMIKDIYRQDFEFLGNFTVHLSWRQEYCGLFRYYKDGVTYYFIDNERYFKRDNLYGYFDDGERFAYFCRAVVESLPHIDFFPDIIHCNDWQSALVPTYIKTGEWADHRYYQIKHIYTIHNVEYQGIYGMENLKDLFGIDEKYTHDMEYDGSINLTKAAIQLSDKITTVSHSYCDNLMQPYCSRGLHHIIYRNEHKLSGIINGIDNEFYNPATDETIYANFDINDMSGKRKNKKVWQEELGLPVDPDTPMLSMVTRLVSHKGLDLMVKILEDLLQDDIQFVIVGTGDQRFIEYFRYLEDKYPTKVRALVDKFSLEFARKNYAGSDIFVMPSKIEPCGISQMVSSRYGTVPVVRECGGLKDTITDFGCKGGGNGYTFTHYNSEDLKYQLKRAISDYHDKEGWAEKMRKVMSQDFSWAKSAKEYVELYDSIMK